MPKSNSTLLLLMLLIALKSYGQPISFPPDSSAVMDNVSLGSAFPFQRENLLARAPAGGYALAPASSQQGFSLAVNRKMGWEQTYEEKRVPLVVGFLLGEAMFALVSTPGFAKNGAYWSAASQHVMSLGSFNGGNWAENDQTRWVSFGMLNALATHHYFVKPTSGASVFWRNFIGLNMVGLTSHLVDKAISKRKARRS